ncbi:MAG: CBS domain-containing protein [Steroidobacteraceae bacterium]
MPPLALNSIANTELPVPGDDPWYAQPEDPALTVMTDFRERSSVTVADAASIDAALEHMKHAGVRCAFVTDAQRRVCGMVTAYDIMSEKPTRHAQSVAGQRRDVLVADIMTRVAEWRVAEFMELRRATVESVYRTFESTRLTHIPVMESGADGQRRLRGLLSAAQVRRVLGR